MVMVMVTLQSLWSDAIILGPMRSTITVQCGLAAAAAEILRLHQ